MLDCQIAILEHALLRTQIGDAPQPIGARFPTIAPSDAFRTADGWIVIGAVTEAQWLGLVEVLGLEALREQARFATMAGRIVDQVALKAAIEAVTALQSTAHWDAVLSVAAVPCGPVRTMADLLQDPQLAWRGMLVDAAGLKTAGSPIRISGFDAPTAPTPAPELDQDRDRLLAEFDPVEDARVHGAEPVQEPDLRVLCIFEELLPGFEGEETDTEAEWQRSRRGGFDDVDVELVLEDIRLPGSGAFQHWLECDIDATRNRGADEFNR